MSNRGSVAGLNKSIFKILFLLLSGYSPGSFAQPNTLYFTKGIPQTKDLNPARPGIFEGFYIGLPFLSKVDLEAITNNWSYSDMIHKGTGLYKDSMVYDPGNFIKKIGDQNYVSESAALTMLEAGFRLDKNTFTFSFSERESGAVAFDKKLIGLAASGNYATSPPTSYTANLSYNLLHFSQIAIMFSRDVTKTVTIGISARFLSGIGAFQSGNISVNGSPSAVQDSLNIRTTGVINISAPPYMKISTIQQPQPINTPALFLKSAVKDLFSNFGNPGFAFDIGFAWHITPRVELSASIIDLGMIRWNKKLYRLSGQGNFLYGGISSGTALPQTTNAINSLSDSISSSFKPDLTATPFSTILQARTYLGLQYDLTKAIALSGLCRVRKVENTVRISLTASANTLIRDRWSLSASYSVMETAAQNLGVAFGLKTGPFQVYSATDNLLSALAPARANNITLRFGINLYFDQPERKKKVKNSLCNQHL